MPNCFMITLGLMFMSNVWIEAQVGNSVIKHNITSNQLLARYITLGADLRELSENFSSPNAKTLLDEIIEHHGSITTDDEL